MLIFCKNFFSPFVCFFFYFIISVPTLAELAEDSPLRDPKFRHFLPILFLSVFSSLWSWLSLFFLRWRNRGSTNQRPRIFQSLLTLTHIRTYHAWAAQSSTEISRDIFRKNSKKLIKFRIFIQLEIKSINKKTLEL